MAVTQNPVAGTTRLDMAMAITKLCSGVLTDEELTEPSLVDSPMLTALAQENGSYCTNRCFWLLVSCWFVAPRR